MIDRHTGALYFEPEVVLRPHQRIKELKSLGLPLKGVKNISDGEELELQLGEVGTRFDGDFEVELVLTSELLLRSVLLSSACGKNEDRRLRLHQAILEENLKGVTDYGWGRVRLLPDPWTRQSWLHVIYRADAVISKTGAPTDALEEMADLPKSEVDALVLASEVPDDI